MFLGKVEHLSLNLSIIFALIEHLREPRVIWEEEEISQMIANEQLEYAIIGKFSYGWPEIQVLRKLIPLQCNLKGEVNIGLLNNRYILIRASRMEDYVHRYRSQFYIAYEAELSYEDFEVGSYLITRDYDCGGMDFSSIITPISLGRSQFFYCGGGGKAACKLIGLCEQDPP
ncbi:hypothetical protein H5410_035357 [Solanum commersonii]|uniref:DUF4283 domain-containing protein n=1 Tax=Solanum commersonii TaxID=4109 RepID=A0A9J5Y1N6_SOLCO|nr:hypothetical protein H5410_035357 [Solanum commersonii]